MGTVPTQHLWRPGLFSRAMGAIDAARDLAMRPDPAVTLGELVVELRMAKDIARMATELVYATEATLAAAMPDRQVVLQGITLVRGKQTRRKYDAPDLVAGQVRRWALENWSLDQARQNGTGEIAEVPVEVLRAAEEVTRALMVAARLEFRTNALRDMGIEPDRYSTVEHGRPTVQLIGPSR